MTPMQKSPLTVDAILAMLRRPRGWAPDRRVPRDRVQAQLFLSWETFYTGRDAIQLTLIAMAGF